MKNWIAAIMILVFLTGCGNAQNYTPQEKPHLYWKDIEVIVTDVDKEYWCATTHWYVVNITVHSDEYGLDKRMEIKGSGAFGCPKEFHYEVGDIVTAQLYSWKMDSTGEIVKREIHCLK